MKKRISLILVFAMLMSLIVPFAIPTASAAASAISNQSELAAMTTDGEYYLANDITISSDWTYSTIFRGTLDGQGHTITFSSSVTVAAGLFQNVSYGATIKNLNIIANVASWGSSRKSGDGYYQSTQAVGGLTASIFGEQSNNGKTKTVTIQNVHVTANLASGSDYSGLAIGGIVGEIRMAKVDIIDCTFNGSIRDLAASHSNDQTGFGGIVGKIHGESYGVKISRCVNNASVSGYRNVGGMLGNSHDSGKNEYVTVEKCINRGSITCTGNTRAGGIVGVIKQNSSGAVDIVNNINYGSVTNAVSSATSAGICSAITNGNASYDRVKYNVNYGTITASSGTTYAILGSGTASLDKNYSTGSYSGTYTSFSDNSSGADTVISALNNTNSTTYVKNGANKVLVVYPITSSVGLYQMDGNGAYSLSNDLTLSGSWSYSKIFKGYFDGGNHTITFANGISITGGLFQNVSLGAVIKNLKIVQASAAGWGSSRKSGDGYYQSSAAVGGLTASIFGTEGNSTPIAIDNVTVTLNAGSNADYNGLAMGGIVGEIRMAQVTISNCTVNGSITSSGDHSDDQSGFGGIIGKLHGATYGITVSQCINNASVSGYRNVGGILGNSHNSGKNNSVTIQKCINTGEITSTNNAYAGGIVGVIKQNSNGAVDIVNNINTGNVTANTSGATPAGICGGVTSGSTSYDRIKGNVNYGTITASSGTAAGVLGSGTITPANNYSTTFASGANHTKLTYAKDSADAFVTLNAAYSGTYFLTDATRVSLAWTRTGSFQTLTKYVGYQGGTKANNKRNIRIIGGYTDSDRYKADEVGLEIRILPSNANGKGYSDSSTQIYGYVVAAGVKVSAASYSSTYLYTAVVQNVPTNLTVDIVIRPFYKLGSTTYYGDYTILQNINVNDIP